MRAMALNLSQTLAATSVENSQRPLKKTIAGLPLHRLGSGRAVVPLFHPQRDGLPFQMTLDLYSSTDSSLSSQLPRDTSGDGVFCLQYILEGAGQVGPAL